MPRHTPCSSSLPVHAGKSATHHTLCTGSSAVRARRCPHLGTPCRRACAACARRCPHRRTPCSWTSAARARRCPHLRTPCSCASAVRVGKQAASSARHGHMLHSSFVHERILCSCVAARLLHPAPSLRSLRRPCPLRSARFSRRNTEIRGPQKPKVRKIRPRHVKYCNSRNPCKRHLQAASLQ